MCVSITISTYHPFTEDEPLAAGHYIDSDAQLKMRVEVAYPLTSYADVQIKTYEETPSEVGCYKG